jgi:hypothetical protein
LMSACVSERAVFFGMCISALKRICQACEGMRYLNQYSLIMYITTWTWLLSCLVYIVSAEENFHFFTCIKEWQWRNIELNWIEFTSKACADNLC